MHTIRQQTFRLIARFAAGLGLGMLLGTTVMAQQVGSQTTPKPVWPDNGIAQRKLPGAYNMFVEHDGHGQWHAWAMNGDGADAQALDFFSGKKMHVKAGLLDNGQQSPDFVDAKGGFHDGVDSASDYPFFLSMSRGMPASGNLRSSSQDFHLEAEGCPERFGSIEGDATNRDSHTKWAKILIYHHRPAPGMAGCPNGAYLSGIEDTLDLGDGTFLAVMNCWIFRLRESDLSPVGSAPALRIVDANAMQKAIDQAKGSHLEDAATYLGKALHLDIDAKNSCP